jgi:endonuclease-8
VPEGPEIRLAADEVQKALAGKKTVDIFFAFSQLKKYQRQLCGQTVSSVQTRGKAMLTRFDNGLVIYTHNQLYGKWIVSESGKETDSHRQLRLAIRNDQYSALLYSASDIEVLTDKELAKQPFLAKLGPDLLSERPQVREIIQRLKLPRFCRRQLASLLLDQGFVAGLGNYLRAEILAYANIHPQKRAVDCSEKELKKLASVMIRLTHRSYRNNGVVNPPALVKRLKAKGICMPKQYRFSVYSREDEPCYHCGTRIKRMDAGGRHIYYCPGCQPR